MRFPSSVSAAEVKLIDKEVQFSESDNGFHTLKAAGDNVLGVPVNWLSPNNFYSGTWHFRYQIIAPPLSNTPGRLQTCIWTMPGFFPENCAGQVAHSGNLGVLTYERTPADWWKKDGVPLSFSDSTPLLIRAVLRGANGCNVTRFNVPGSCWDQWSKFAPMRFRVTIVMVSQGSTFSGWENYDLSDSGPISPQVSPFPTIPRASTSCFHTCVWDTGSTPNCRIRNFGNMCGTKANPAKCEAIDVAFVCAYASFDCPAGSCDLQPINRQVSRQDTYCNASGGPTSDPSTGELYTAIGCIPVDDVTAFVRVILPVLLSLGGGVSFLLIIYASFMIKTSAGDPRKMQLGKELLTASLAGLTLVIFAVFVLRIVVQEVLRVPGI